MVHCLSRLSRRRLITLQEGLRVYPQKHFSGATCLFTENSTPTTWVRRFYRVTDPSCALPTKDHLVTPAFCALAQPASQSVTPPLTAQCGARTRRIRASGGSHPGHIARSVLSPESLSGLSQRAESCQSTRQLMMQVAPLRNSRTASSESVRAQRMQKAPWLRCSAQPRWRSLAWVWHPKPL
jgi:hypothetical protein